MESKSWVVFRPQSGNGLGAFLSTQAETPTSVSLISFPLEEEEDAAATTVVSCFPKLPHEARCGKAVLNRSGQLLAIFSPTSLFLVTLKQRLEPLEESSHSADHWQLKNSDYILDGKLLNSNEFQGNLAGNKTKGSFHLFRTAPHGSWNGKFVDEGFREWDMQLNFDPISRTYSLGEAYCQQVDAVAYCKGNPVLDVHFHYSNSLIVLDSQQTVRIYRLHQVDKASSIKPLKSDGGGGAHKLQVVKDSLFVLFPDGSLLGLSPVCDPQASWQMVDKNPSSPEERFNHQKDNATCCDFTATLHANSAIVLHRLWTCGRLEVLYLHAPSLPEHYKSTTRVHHLRLESVGQGKGPFRTLRSKLSPFGEFSEETPGPLVCLDVVNCFAVFNEPGSHHTLFSLDHALPLVFAALSENGEIIVFKDSWAFPGEVCNQISFTYLERVPNSVALAVFTSPLAGVGLLMDPRKQVNFTTSLRFLGNNQHAKAASNNFLLLGNDMDKDGHEAKFAEYQQEVENAFKLMDEFQLALNGFPQVPSEFSQQVLPALKNNVDAANWLNEVFNWCVNDQDSLLNRLFVSQQQLAHTSQRQGLIFNRIQEEAIKWREANVTLEKNIRDLDQDLQIFQSLCISMRFSARKYLSALHRLKTPLSKAPSKDVADIRSLMQTRQACERAKDQIDVKLGMCYKVLTQNKEELSRSSSDEVSEKEEHDAKLLSWLWLDTFSLLDEVGIPVHLQKPVFLVWTKGGLEEEILVDFQLAVQKRQKVRVFLPQDLLDPHMQTVLRRSLRVLDIPLFIAKESVQLVLMDEDMELRWREMYTELDIEFRLQGDKALSPRVEVTPMRFASSDANFVFGHIFKAEESCRLLLKRFEQEPLLSCLHEF